MIKCIQILRHTGIEHGKSCCEALSSLRNKTNQSCLVCYLGLTRWLNVTLFLTFILEPDGAPQNVQGQNSSSTSILVMWDEVPADQQNGIITGYNITYQSQTENDDGTVQVNGSVRQTELTNLREYVDYNITVFAFTVRGDGPASVPIVVRTDQDSK